MNRLIRYRLAPIYALLLTIALYGVTQPFASSDSIQRAYAYSLLSQRGPVPYLIVFITFVTLLMTATARYQADRRTTTLIGLYGFAAFPILLGMFATANGFIFLHLDAAYFHDLDKLAHMDFGEMSERISQYHRGLAYATDPLHLGLLSALITWPIIFWHAVKDLRKPVKQHQAD